MAQKTSARSQLHHFMFPTVYPNCYQVEVIDNLEQYSSIDPENFIESLYQTLDKIVLDKYSNFNGGVRPAYSSNISNTEQSMVEPWTDVSNIFVPVPPDPWTWLCKGKEQEEEKKKEEPTTPTYNQRYLSVNKTGILIV